MEVCFSRATTCDFLREHSPEIDSEVGPGWFVNSEGVKLGGHKGFPYYTIGQRKGLEIALGKPAYVLKINPQKNTVMLGDAEQLKAGYMLAEEENLIDEAEFFGSEELTVRIRYRSKPIPCTVKRLEDGRLLVRFLSEASAIAPDSLPCSTSAGVWLAAHSSLPNGASGCILQKIIKTQIYEKTLFPSTFHLGCCRRIGATRHFEYRISLKDKAATTYSLEHPEAFLSEKAIERRLKQNLPIDSTDLPVCRKYVDEIRRQGVKIVVTGKWENFVTVSCNDSALVERIARPAFCPGDGKGMDSSRR